MATDGFNSFVIFLYADGLIEWTTGDDSEGIGGLGGIPALVGVNAGDGVQYEIVPESLTDDIINIDMTSNIGVPGVWVFRVNGDNMTVGECSFGPDGKSMSVALTINPSVVYITTTVDCE